MNALTSSLSLASSVKSPPAGPPLSPARALRRARPSIFLSRFSCPRAHAPPPTPARPCMPAMRAHTQANASVADMSADCRCHQGQSALRGLSAPVSCLDTLTREEEEEEEGQGGRRGGTGGRRRARGEGRGRGVKGGGWREARGRGREGGRGGRGGRKTWADLSSSRSSFMRASDTL